MTDTIVALLDRERAAFLEQVARVPRARQAQRLDPERWSATEIVEHVARIDTGVAKIFALKLAGPLTATPEELAQGQMTPDKAARVRNRAERIQAPERVHPTGTLTPEAAMGQLVAARAALLAAYLGADTALLDGAVFPHPIIGVLTLRSWVELAAHHDARHAQQLAELADGWAEHDNS